MPGKSQHSKGKHPSRRKKGKGRPGLAIAAQQPAVAQTYKPVPQPKAPPPSVSAPAPRAAPTAARHPYIISELRRIGILAGIMLAILVVLVLVLS